MKKLIFALILTLVASPVFAEQKTFAWDAVTTDIEGNTIVVTGYRLYIGTATGVYPSPPAATVTTTTGAVNVTVPGTYFAIVRAYNNVGESANSNEVSFVIAPKPPRTPLNLRKTN